jgi:prepilin-type processing-associated H-X9-DG protein
VYYANPPVNKGLLAVNTGGSYPKDPHDNVQHSLNYLAADGHVKFVPVSLISSGNMNGIGLPWCYNGYTGVTLPNAPTSLGAYSMTLEYH